MTAPATPPISPTFLAAFQHAAGAAGVMSFARFMDLALYDRAAGYYVRPRRRIGRESSTDFYTAPSLGPVFHDLVAAACAGLLGHLAPADHVFLELGVELTDSTPDGTIALPGPSGLGQAGIAPPFAAAMTLARGQPFTFPPRAVVFSNELFDAQPFHRLVHRDGRWRECGVALRGGVLEEVLLPEFTPEVVAVQERLPARAAEGYRIDLPLAAAQLADQIAAQRWSGLFVAVDYGKSWRELVEETPGGTARAYHRHRQHDDLLARPGEQDLTCHLCWDWLIDRLAARGFSAPMVESQEAFFIHHAAPALERLTADEAGRLSPRKLAVMQLLHPGNMGQKFQVLWARRE